MALNLFNGRLTAASLAAASAGLSVALISLAKVLLVVTALMVLLRGRRVLGEDAPLEKMWTPRLVLLILFVFACSLLWTSAPMSQALGAMGKYGKFLVIPALLVLIRTRREASWVLAAFVGAQAFLLISSWLLYFEVPLIWATSKYAKNSYAVFSTYLDQSIVSAVVATIFWYFKRFATYRPLFYVAVVMSLLALGNVFVVFAGRTGHLVGIAMVSLAMFWALPARYRVAALLIPPLLFLLAFLSFDNVGQRFSGIKTDVSAFYSGVGAATSMDNRLDFWQGSVDAIVEKPSAGSGVGSWAVEYNRLQRLKFPGHEDLEVGSNPHQEFLLWGVQLGVGGIMLLFAFMVAVMLDLRKMDTPIARAGQSVLAALAISCSFNSSLYDAHIGDFFCVTLGVLLAYGFHSREVSQVRPAENISSHE